MKKLHCAALVTALITLLTVFLANVGHTEYKSQVRKYKTARAAKSNNNIIIDDTVDAAPLMDLTTTTPVSTPVANDTNV